MVSSAKGVVGVFLLFHIYEFLCILFELGFSWAITVASIMSFQSTVVASHAIQISPGSLLFLFSVAFVVPILLVWRKNEVVADPVGLRIFIRFIIRLIVE